MSARRRTLFASVNLIGDTLTQTPAIRAYRRLHPDREVHWMVQDDAMRPLLEGMPGAGVCDRVLFDTDWGRVRDMAYDGYDERFLMDVQRAFAIGRDASVHIAQAYGRMIGVDIAPDDILPTVPIADEAWNGVGMPPRSLVISTGSTSNAPVDGYAGNKNLPWRAWPKIVDRFVEAGRIDHHVVLLREHDPPPEVPMCVLRLSLPWAAAYIAKACALGGAYCGVDNGMTHIAAGLRVPTFCVYPGGMAEGWVGYTGFDHYRIAKTLPWKGDVDGIWGAWKTRLN